MRGGDVRTESLFSYLSCEARVPQDHPLRPIWTIVDQALTVLSPGFDRLYSDLGRPSIPPEKLLRALLLQAFYSVRSERQLMEQLELQSAEMRATTSETVKLAMNWSIERAGEPESNRCILLRQQSNRRAGIRLGQETLGGGRA